MFKDFFSTEAESKEKHGVWDPMPELTITSPYVDSSNTCTIGNPIWQSRPQPYARVDFISQSETKNLASAGTTTRPRSVVRAPRPTGAAGGSTAASSPTSTGSTSPTQRQVFRVKKTTSRD
jgi:hypothetical protein